MTVTAPLRELAVLFLRLGVTAFGGPAAHIAMMRDEVVDRRGWLSDREFLDLVAATNLIPGPNSTELAIHLGYRRGGLAGLSLAGVCFILPAALVVGCIAWAYARYGTTPQVGWLMYGIGPVVIAIVAQALVKLGQAALSRWVYAPVGAAALVAALAGVNELAVLGAGAAIGLALAMRPSGPGRSAAVLAWLAALPAALAHLQRGAAAAASQAGATVGAAAGSLAAATVAAVPFTLSGLTLFFLKVGSVLFGSGYVLLAFLRADLVERWGWLTDQQLIDAITVGQVTPGPVFTTATFIGYLLGGWAGAVLATAAIFAPGFFFVAVTQPLIPRLRASRALGGCLDGVVAASLGLMAAVTWQLARAAVVDLPTALIVVAAAVILFRWRPNSTWLILGGAAAGWLLRGWESAP
ncbi:MAG: chromate efflux transporter [Acidobacteria bacterium]|nr:chromate efflux transporter [Acidobacteriota bacterium]